VRIHRSVIVNVERIREIRPCNSGEFIVTLTNGKEVPASRNYRDNLIPLLTRTL
jgi:two-component system LytT family response regulator